MDEKLVHEILDELIPSFEALETQSAAVLQLLKDKGMTTDEEFGPYLERASNGSGVRWLAVRVRLERLLSGAIEAAQKKAAEESHTAVKSNPETEQGRQPEKNDTSNQKGTPSTGDHEHSAHDARTESQSAAQTQAKQVEGNQKTEADAA